MEHKVLAEGRIVEVKTTTTPRYSITQSGYTIKNGAPTQYLIRLAGEKRFRRLMCWQFSNSGTCFIRINGQVYIVHNYHMPSPLGANNGAN